MYLYCASKIGSHDSRRLSFPSQEKYQISFSFFCFPLFQLGSLSAQTPVFLGSSLMQEVVRHKASIYLDKKEASLLRLHLACIRDTVPYTHLTCSLLHGVQAWALAAPLRTFCTATSLFKIINLYFYFNNVACQDELAATSTAFSLKMQMGSNTEPGGGRPLCLLKRDVKHKA